MRIKFVFEISSTVFINIYYIHTYVLCMYIYMWLNTANEFKQFGLKITTYKVNNSWKWQMK